jgi:hypothetical protein
VTRLHARMEQLLTQVAKTYAATAQQQAVCPLHREWMEPVTDSKGTYYRHTLPSGRVCHGGTRPVKQGHHPTHRKQVE